MQGEAEQLLDQGGHSGPVQYRVHDDHNIAFWLPISRRAGHCSHARQGQGRADLLIGLTARQDPVQARNLTIFTTTYALYSARLGLQLCVLSTTRLNELDRPDGPTSEAK